MVECFVVQNVSLHTKPNLFIAKKQILWKINLIF